MKLTIIFSLSLLSLNSFAILDAQSELDKRFRSSFGEYINMEDEVIDPDKAYTGTADFIKCQRMISKKWNVVSSSSYNNKEDLWKLPWKDFLVKKAYDEDGFIPNLANDSEITRWNYFLGSLAKLRKKFDPKDRSIRITYNGQEDLVYGLVKNLRAKIKTVDVTCDPNLIISQSGEQYCLEKELREEFSMALPVVFRASEVQSVQEIIVSNVKGFVDESDELFNDLAQCEGYRSSTFNFTAYDDTEVSQNFSEAKSSDGKIHCRGVGAESQDFIPCRDSIPYYDGMTVGKQAMAMVQQVNFQGKAMETQMEAQANGATDATAGMKAQRDMIKEQNKIVNQNVAIDGATLAALTKIWNDMPTRESLNLMCSENSRAQFVFIHKEKNKFMSKLAEAINKTTFISPLLEMNRGEEEQVEEDKLSLPGQGAHSGGQFVQVQKILYNDVEDEPKADSLCNRFVFGEGNHSMVNNTIAKDSLKSAMIEAGVSMVGNIAQATMLKKQSGLIDDAIKKVDAFKPEDLAYDENDQRLTECMINPMAEGCSLDSNNRDVDMAGGGINISGFSGATTDAYGNSDLGGTAVDGSSSSDAATDRTNNVGPGGSAISHADKGGGLTDTVAGASVKAGAGGGAAGGGGGGGAPGGASAPNGGAGRAGGGSGESMPGKSMFANSFSGGGGTLKMSGGSYSKRKKASKSANPFAKMFKKKKTGKNVNFRDVASIGNKKGSIFDMISKRYNKVSTSDRILKYKIVEKN